MRLIAVLAIFLSSILNAQQTTSSKILAENSSGWTALGTACYDENVDLIKQWFETIEAEEGTEAVCKCIKTPNTDGYTPLMLACAHNYQTMSVYKYLLEVLEELEGKQATADYIELTSKKGKTALMLASACSNMDIVKFLVEYIESAESDKDAVEYIKLKDKANDDAINYSEKNVTYTVLIEYLKQYIADHDKQ